MYIHHSLLPTNAELERDAANSSNGMNQAVSPIGKRSGKKLPSMVQAKPVLVDPEMLDSSLMMPSKRIALLVGELLHVLRPVIYSTLTNAC